MVFQAGVKPQNNIMLGGLCPPVGPGDLSTTPPGSAGRTGLGLMHLQPDSGEATANGWIDRSLKEMDQKKSH